MNLLCYGLGALSKKRLRRNNFREFLLVSEWVMGDSALRMNPKNQRITGSYAGARLRAMQYAGARQRAMLALA